MFRTEFNSETVYILNDPWDGAGGAFDLEVSIVRDARASLTKREGRRPYTSLPLCAASFQVILQGDALRSALAALRELTTEPVICPVWPLVSLWSDRASAPVEGGLKLVWKADWSQYELYTDEEPVWPAAGDLWAPVLYGQIERGEPRVISPAAAVWPVDFQESSPAAYALQPTAFAPAVGPQPAGYATAPRLLPFQPDFTQAAEQLNVDIGRDRLSGTHRQRHQTFYPHAAQRVQRARYTLHNNEPGQLMRFFLDYAGAGAAFWASGWLQVARLTSHVAETDTVLSVETSAGIKVGDYLNLYGPSGEILPRKVTGTTEDTITLDSAPGVDLPAATTAIFPLALARLETPHLKYSWLRPGLATAEIAWIEQPVELTIPADETLGVSLGRLPQRVVLFQFTRNLGNGTVLNWYFTNCEADLDYDGVIWLSADISCSDIPQSLNIEQDSVEISSFIFAGNPLVDDVTLAAEAPLTVTIRFADYDGANVSNAQVVFTGDASAPSRQGDKLSVKCRMGPALFDTELPLFLRGTICNHLRGSNADGLFLISAGCTLLKADWEHTAEVAGPISSAFPYTLHLSNLARTTGPVPTYFENWFADGWIEWGAGANIQRRAILASTTPAAGALSITLHRYWNGIPLVGDPVKLYPGCDGTYATCKAYDAESNPLGKFNNALNFGAEPFTPSGNPSFSGQPNVGVHGGKK